MQFQKFLDPFGAERAARDQESQIAGRDARTSVDLFNMQQQMDQRRNRMAMLQEMAQDGQQPKAQPGQPQGQQQGQQQQQPSASDMILGELGKIDRGIALAAKYGQLDEQDKYMKLREQAMGRYSLAKERETQATDRIDKQRKEAVSAVSRFASGANTILSDDKIPTEDKRQQLEELETAIREENPQAYKVLTQGQPAMNWADPRTWNRMKALEQQAITPEKRTDMAIAKMNAETRAKSEQDRARNIDRLIASTRDGGSHERLPVGKKWVDPKDHDQGMEDIPDKSKAAPSIPSDLHGQAYLDALPEEDRGLIKGIAEGRINPTTLSTKGGHREAILKQVAQYNPDYKQRKFAIYQAVERDATSGVLARNATAINTNIAHIGTMWDAADALQNHDTQGINTFVNNVRTQFGKPEVNNFELAKGAVASEMMRVFRQVGASEAETKEWGSRFSANQSPEQLKQGMRQAAELLRGRIDAVDDQWKRGMDTKEPFPNLISEKSRSVLQKIGVKVRDDGTKAPAKKGGAMSLDDYLTSKGG